MPLAKDFCGIWVHMHTIHTSTPPRACGAKHHHNVVCVGTAYIVCALTHQNALGQESRLLAAGQAIYDP